MATKYEEINGEGGKESLQESDDEHNDSQQDSCLLSSAPQDSYLLSSAPKDSYLLSSAPQASTDHEWISHLTPYPIHNQQYPSGPSQLPAVSTYPLRPYLPPPAAPQYGQQTHNTTTVIVQQPSQLPVRPYRNWSSRICECGKDWSICCCGLFCKSCLEGEVAQNMGESAMLPCCVPGWLIVLRTKMRLQENIHGTVLDDCCQVTCCGRCVLCQLAYEIKVVREGRQAMGTEFSQV